MGNVNTTQTPPDIADGGGARDQSPMKKTAKPGAAAKRKAKSRNPNTDASAVLSNTGAEARLAIGVVIFFVIAFILVIGMKLLQERRAALANAVLSQAYSATMTAEQVRTKLTDVRSFASALALSTRETSNRQSSALVRRGMAELVARPVVQSAIVFAGDGRVVDSEGVFEDSAALWNDLPDWVRGEKAAAYWLREQAQKNQLLVVAPIGNASQPSIMAITISGDSLVPPASPGGIDTVIIDRTGNLLSKSSTQISPALLERLVTEAKSADLSADQRAISGFPLRDAKGEHLMVGASSLLGGTLRVYRVMPLSLNDATWTRTITFFVLMTIAPLLVAAVLCVILLVQMDSLKVARQALLDSERRFRLAIEGARSGVWDWDTSSGQVFVTDSLAKMFSWKKGAIVPVAEFLNLVHRDDRQKLSAAMAAGPETGEVDVEFRAANLPIWLHARGRPWRSENTTSSGRIVGVAIEITEQKGAQARLNAAETRLRAALESMSESFVVWDVKRRLIMCNRKFSDFFRIEPSALRPGTPYDVLEKAAEPAIKAVHDGADENAIELELADGRWVHLSERPTRDGGLVGIGTDITALKVQEQLLLGKEKDLRETVDDLELSKTRISELAESYQQEKIRAIEANSSKSEFLANMSHELRTPLNAINGFSEIMQTEMYGPLGDDRYKEYVGDILGSGQHLLSLINDILDMSKIEAGKMSLQTETVYVDEVIEQCMRIVRGRAVESGLKLDVNIAALPTIKADPRAVKQVLINLTSNAIKFTLEGGTVTVNGHEERGGVRLDVVDTGIGIPEEHLPLICKPFVQVESQHSKSHKGSGLGLALSQSLILLHGGEFTLTSTLGVGTTVSVWLPAIAKESDDEAPDPATASENSEDGEADTPSVDDQLLVNG